MFGKLRTPSTVGLVPTYVIPNARSEEADERPERRVSGLQAMGASQSIEGSSAPTEHVLVVGGTGRTGRRLVKRLCADPHFEVTAVVRSHEKAQLVFGEDLDAINVVEGDLTDVEAWAHRLEGVSQIVTAVSSGLCTDAAVVLGAKEAPPNLPMSTDGEGIAKLADAAKQHGVRRMVAVTTASAGSPWSPAAIFLNAYHYCSVKWKWEGEQAIRASGLDYVVLRPYGLGRDVAPPPGKRGIEFTQGKSPGGTRRRIPREDVARLCHEALLLDPSSSRRATFECWATEEHGRPMDWNSLQSDPPGRLPEVNHDAPLAVVTGGSALLTAGVLRSAVRLAARLASRT